MDINIKKTKGKALYIQLYDAIVEEILSGRLKNGMRLPARRAMAEELRIAETTVDSAYKMLQDTGYIISIPRRGFVVSFKTSPYEKTVPWENAAPEEIVFSPNGTDVAYLPRTSYAKILKDILYNYGIDIFSYPEKGGELHFRNELSKYLYFCRDIKCSPSRIIIGAGAEYLLSSLSAALEPDTGYILENPCDTHFYHTLSAYGRKIVTLPSNAGGFDIDALYASDGNVLCVEPDTRFPRGEALPPEIRAEILEWAYSSPDRYILENGYDAELQSARKKTLYSMDTENRVIYLSSFSRSLSPAFKTAYMIIPEKLLELWKKRHVYYYSLVSKQEQYALAEFIGKGYFAKHYKRMRKIYRERRELLESCLLSAFGDGIRIYRGDASTYISAELLSMSADEVKLQARKVGVKLLSLNSFNVYKKTAPIKNDRLVIGAGDLDNEKIRLGIRLLKDCLNSSTVS